MFFLKAETDTVNECNLIARASLINLKKCILYYSFTRMVLRKNKLIHEISKKEKGIIRTVLRGHNMQLYIWTLL